MDDLETVADSLKAAPEYFNALVREESNILMIRFKYADDPEMQRYAIEHYDAMRRFKHEALTTGVNVLNRLARINGVPEIFDTPDKRDLDISNSEDREIAADLCYNFCVETFLDAKARIKLSQKEIRNRNDRENQAFEIGRNNDMFSEDVKEKLDKFETESEI